LAIFLGHNFDLKKLAESSGKNFEAHKRWRLRLASFALIAASYPFTLFTLIVVNGIGFGRLFDRPFWPTF
jgi:hypothetical protein